MRVSIELFGMDDSTYQGEPTPPVGLGGRDPMDSEGSGSDQNAIRHCSRGLVQRKYIEIEETSQVYIATDSGGPRISFKRGGQWSIENVKHYFVVLASCNNSKRENILH